MAKTPLNLIEIIDSPSLREELGKLAASTDAGSADCRNEVMKLLKTHLAEGRQRAEAMLAEDGGGTACATRLSHLMDEIIRALHDFAAHVYPSKNRSAAERMAVVAVGGYG